MFCFRSKVYPEHLLLEAIRMSLKGKARTVLLHLGELASSRDILFELEGIYGNVSSSEKVKEQFYCAKQEPSESIADYSLRLEHLLSQSSMTLAPSTRNEMLCSRLWSGIYDKELRTAARYKYESISDYGVLRRELRLLEKDLQINKQPDTASVSVQPVDSPVPLSEPASQFMSFAESKLLQQLQDLTSQMKQLNSRVGTMESELQTLKKSGGSSQGSGSGKWHDKRRDGSTKDNQKTEKDAKMDSKGKPLNERRPSP